MLGSDKHPQALMHIQSLSGRPGSVNIGMEILQEQAVSRDFSFWYFGQVFSSHAVNTTKNNDDK